jgi:cytochrome c6
MKGSPNLQLVSALLSLLVCAGCTGNGERMSGADMFSLRCAACHPGGGNTISPHKTLHSGDLRANGIRSPGDIVAIMRNPGTGMPRFGTAIIPDREAMLIADYILTTFR